MGSLIKKIFANTESEYLLGLGWIAGLLARSLPAGETLGWLWPMLGCLLGAALYRQRRKLALTWLITGVIALLAWGYLGLRTPQAGPQDVSRFAPQPRATVIGKITTDPQTTRSGRQRFWLETQEVQTKDKSGPATGRLYVTMAPKVIADKDVHPGQTLKMQGFLYLPSPALTPGSFDFQKYLQDQGSFAGFSAYELEISDPGQPWGGWALRRRVRSALVTGLGKEQGELLSSMVLGSKAAELEYDLADAFRSIGLAHVLAASGFQVSLLIGVVLALTQGASPRIQQVIILIGLGIYILLTGFSPPVVRAGLMGVAATVALTETQLKGKFNPLGLLLASGVLILIWNPTWITSLSFQLSYLATLGLMVGAEPITQWLSWLPLALASTMSVTLAATLWTLPIQIYAFGQVANYFLVANLVTVVLVMVISVLGYAICAAALVIPPVGSLLSQPMQIFLTPMTNLVTWISSWPGTTYYTGAVSWIQCVLLYGVLFAITFWPVWKEKFRWQGTGILMAGIIWLPGLWPGHPVELTMLATERAPVMVIQTEEGVIFPRRSNLLINTGSDETVKYTILPFLRQAGIRTIDDAIATVGEGVINGGWESILAAFPIRQFWDGGGVAASGAYGQALASIQAKKEIAYQGLKVGDFVKTDPILSLQVVETRPLVLLMKTEPATDTWLLLGTANPAVQKQLIKSSLMPAKLDWIWWDGGALSLEFLKHFQVESGVAYKVEKKDPWFEDPKHTLYITNEGSLQWNAKGIKGLASLENE